MFSEYLNYEGGLIDTVSNNASKSSFSFFDLKSSLHPGNSDNLLFSLIDLSKWFAEILSLIIGYIGLGIMVYGVFLALLLMLRRVFGQKIALGQIRLELGHYLVLSLEFLVAKDILESIFSPSLQTLLELLLIVIIRTILTHFLNKELQGVKEEIAEELSVKNFGGAGRNFPNTKKRLIASISNNKNRQ